MVSAEVSKRTIFEYTCSSRMRRPMTWVYCEPKSRMRIFECFGGDSVFTPITDEFAGRRARWRDRLMGDQADRLFPGRSRRAQAGLPLLACCVVPTDRHTHPR